MCRKQTQKSIKNQILFMWVKKWKSNSCWAQNKFAFLTDSIIRMSIWIFECDGLLLLCTFILCMTEHNSGEQRERPADSLLMPAIGLHRAEETASKSEWFGECIKLAYKGLIVPILEWKVCFQIFFPLDNWDRRQTRTQCTQQIRYGDKTHFWFYKLSLPKSIPTC